MSAHTPGPWIVSSSVVGHAGQPFKIDEFFVYAPNTQDDVAICSDVFDPRTQEPSIANARLIAAAPDLLAALQAVLHDCENLDMVESNEPGRDAGPWLMATNAIAKAKGAAA